MLGNELSTSAASAFPAVVATPNSGISGLVSLLYNLAMVRMTNKLQAVLDDRERVARPAPEVSTLRHVSPVYSKGINFRGRFHFPTIRAYSSRILAVV